MITVIRGKHVTKALILESSQDEIKFPANESDDFLALENFCFIDCTFAKMPNVLLLGCVLIACTVTVQAQDCYII